MFDAWRFQAALQTSEYFGSGRDPVKLGSAHPRNAPYQVFKAKDRYFAMAAGNDGLWKSACEALNRAELATDPRFISTADRARNQAALKEIVEAEFAKYTAHELLAKFRAAGVPCAPINSYSQILADEQVQHMQWVQEIVLPSGKATRTFVAPALLRQRLPGGRQPPALGEHNAEILAPREAVAASSELLSERSGATLTLTQPAGR
jgi:crotonobetainyl-CoA:carnitine CoA-transferase CaiB-like acyl-CoA transferase